MSNNRLFVGNLSWDTHDQSLGEAFKRFGIVTDAKVITDRDTGKPRGFGFVTFESEADAAEALKGMDGVDLDGRNIRVSEATQREGGGGQNRSRHGDQRRRVADDSEGPEIIRRNDGGRGGLGNPRKPRSGKSDRW